MTPEQQVEDIARIIALHTLWAVDCNVVAGEYSAATRDAAQAIVTALSARQEPDEYVMELENIVCDALHTLENEMTAGTRFDEPEWVRGTLAALRSIKGTMDDRDPSPPSVATPD